MYIRDGCNTSVTDIIANALAKSSCFRTSRFTFDDLCRPDLRRLPRAGKLSAGIPFAKPAPSNRPTTVHCRRTATAPQDAGRAWRSDIDCSDSRLRGDDSRGSLGRGRSFTGHSAQTDALDA